MSNPKSPIKYFQKEPVLVGVALTKIHYCSKIFFVLNVSYALKILFWSLRLHLFDQKHSKNSKNKYEILLGNLKYLIYIWVGFKM